MDMTKQIQQYQLAGVDIEQVDVYRDFMDRYRQKPKIDLEQDAAEFKTIFEAIKRDRQWPTSK